MSYALYGKRESDKRFAPLDYLGFRVSNKKDIHIFPTRNSAQKRLDEVSVKDGCVIEIRKVKE